MTKRVFHLTVLDENGEDDVVEVVAYSDGQAEFLSNNFGGTVVIREEAVAKMTDNF